MILDKKPASTLAEKIRYFVIFCLQNQGKFYWLSTVIPKKKALAILNYAEI